MDLEYRITKLLYGGYGTYKEMAKQILSLPSGMEKVKECLKCNEPYKINSRDKLPITDSCPACHGSGEIVTDMTIGEVVEEFTRIVSEAQHANEFASIHDEADYNHYLPSGERVRVSK